MKDNRYAKYKPIYDMFIALYPFTTDNLDGEIWLPIPDYEELYHGSNFGRVKSFARYPEGKILKPLLSKGGYLRASLSKNGKNKNFLLNQLVGRLFIPNPDNKPQVNHIYSRFSNHVDCLEWATGSENVKHAVATGLQPSGEDDWHAKLTNEQVQYIRSNPEGLTTVQLAEMFDIAQATISNIQRGKSYKNAGGNIRGKKPSGKPRVPDEQRAQIIARYNAGGITQLELAKEFSCSQATIWNIIHEAD